MDDPDHGAAPDLSEVRRGLRMAAPPDPEGLAKEREHLRGLESSGWAKRSFGYLKLGGPGYLQSAMTLGSGTAASSLFAGAVFGYELLWVAPVAMALGVLMLSAVAHQTLSTGLRPFDAMRRFAGAPFAWAWALGALIASVIWHFPQYALAAGAVVDLADAGGIGSVPPMAASVLVLAIAVPMSLLYGSGLVRWYERILKWMVWAIVLCFGAVVIQASDRIDWAAVGRGFTTIHIPAERNGISGLSIVVSGLAAAVGINMLFLYPYTLLARGWGREHRRLARYDLGFGMLVPYALATTLMVIAMAATLHAEGIEVGKRLAPVTAAHSLQGIVGETWSRVVLDVGFVGMALSSITLHMLCAGFVACEVLGFEVGSRKHRLATLLPIPGALAPLLWGDMLVYLAVPTNIVCGLFLPTAYVAFILMQRNRDFLGPDTPRGWRGTTWIAGMALATLVLTVALLRRLIA